MLKIPVMEKILFAVDALSPNYKTLDFAAYLGQLTRSSINALFLENDIVYEKPLLKRLHSITYPEWEMDEISSACKTKSALIEKQVALFQASCVSRNIGCTILHAGGSPAEELLQQSRFADVIVLDGATSFHERYEGSPTLFVREILKKAECPVIIAPERFEGVDEIIFAYNGSASSVFAIKQFTHLFPQLATKKATVVHINEDGTREGSDSDQLHDWMTAHYRHFQFETLKGEAETILLGYLLKKNTFLVMGAYGRNSISQFFQPSHANRLIKTTDHPIFIAHL